MLPHTFSSPFFQLVLFRFLPLSRNPLPFLVPIRFIFLHFLFPSCFCSSYIFFPFLSVSLISLFTPITNPFTIFSSDTIYLFRFLLYILFLRSILFLLFNLFLCFPLGDRRIIWIIVLYSA